MSLLDGVGSNRSPGLVLAPRASRENVLHFELTRSNRHAGFLPLRVNSNHFNFPGEGNSEFVDRPDRHLEVEAQKLVGCEFSLRPEEHSSIAEIPRNAVYSCGGLPIGRKELHAERKDKLLPGSVSTLG